MSGYRRFVAYVYEYRKGKKENNCGFVKVEVRDERCTMEVHLNCPGLASQMECRVYGFVRKAGRMEGILLGSCETEAGAVECLMETDSLNMGGAGVSLGQMGGMAVTTELGGFWGTGWDDQPIRPADFREMKQSGSGGKEKRERGEEPESAAQLVPEEEKEQESSMDGDNIEKNRTEEHSAEEDSAERDNGEERRMREYDMETDRAKERDAERDNAEEKQEERYMVERESEETDSAEQTVTEKQSVEEPDAESLALEGAYAEQGKTVGLTASAPVPGAAAPDFETLREQMPSGGRPPHPGPIPGFGEECCPFDDGEMVNCRKIQPRDLAHFSRRDAALRNNRFLLYGYYNFGHLLLCEKSNGQYILGIPGGYDQQERFMANMFGFPYFKESRRIELPKGRGGYWYRLINAPDFH